VVGSPLESHSDHLTIDGYHTRVLTLREEPSEKPATHLAATAAHPGHLSHHHRMAHG